MEELGQSLALADAHLATARAAVRALTQRAKDQRRRSWVLTKWLTNVVLIIYGLAGYQVEPARFYLAQAARKRRRRIWDLPLRV